MVMVPTADHPCAKLLDDDGEVRCKEREKEKTLELKEIDAIIIGRVQGEEPLSSSFMQAGAQPIVLPPSPALFPQIVPSIQEHGDWVTNTKEKLFNPPYRMGRVLTLSGSISGNGWIPGLYYVITCAHIAHKARGEPLYFQLFDDSTIISLSVVYCGPEASAASNYKTDVACLKMESVVNATPLCDVPLASFKPGHIDWTRRCITVGILKPYSATNACSAWETQKMLNEGRVESLSSSLVTVSARADSGFSGGPIINTSFEIVGMVQGGEGDVIKTVKMIPISDIVTHMSVISFFDPGLPSFELPTGVGGTTF